MIRTLCLSSLQLNFFLLCCGCMDQEPNSESVQPLNIKTQEPTSHNDLELVAKLTTPTNMESGKKPGFELKLRNNSKTTSYQVIKPGDGSEMGWRPPHVYFTVEFLNPKSEWEIIPAVSYGRCGNYDRNWQDEIQTLKPQGILLINQWIARNCAEHYFFKAGKYRVTWHYHIDTKLKKINQKIHNKSDKSQVVPDIRLKSKPVEISVTCPLVLELNVKKKVQTRPSTTNGFQHFELGNSLAITLKNDSDITKTITLPTCAGESRLLFEVLHPADSVIRTISPGYQEDKNTSVQLAPQKKLDILGGNAAKYSYSWESYKSGEVKVRAVLKLSTWKRGSILHTRWYKIILPNIKPVQSK